MWKIKMGFWSGELVWNDWQSCLKLNIVKSLLVESYRKFLHVLAWSGLAYFKNWLVINHSCTWSFALYLPIKTIKKVISLSSTDCLIPTGSCYAMLLETQTKILISPSLFFHQWNYDTSTGAACWCQHKREKNQVIVLPLLKQQYLWLNILEHELWAALLGDVC